MGRYERKTNHKLMFTEQNLGVANRRLEQGDSQRQVARDMRVNEANSKKKTENHKYGTLGYWKLGINS